MMSDLITFTINLKLSHLGDNTSHLFIYLMAYLFKIKVSRNLAKTYAASN